MGRYGYTHQRIRKALFPFAYGGRCHFCGELMLPGEPLDLDHTADGLGYRGMTHAECNRRDGARRRFTQASRKW